MNGSTFKLGTFARPGGAPFAAIVLGDKAVDLAQAHARYRSATRRGALSDDRSLLGLLSEWDANFAVLQEMVAFL
jgi:hypothetical protein